MINHAAGEKIVVRAEQRTGSYRSAEILYQGKSLADFALFSRMSVWNA